MCILICIFNFSSMLSKFLDFSMLLGGGFSARALRWAGAGGCRGGPGDLVGCSVLCFMSFFYLSFVLPYLLDLFSHLSPFQLPNIIFVTLVTVNPGAISLMHTFGTNSLRS